MSQNDFTIANQGFPAFRADLNSALQALATNSSGATEPLTTFANMWWYDSANDIMYIRNEDNDAWIKFAELDQANDKFVLSGTLQLDDGTVSAPALTFNSDTNMGIYRGGTDILKFVTAGTDAITITASQQVGIGVTPSFNLHVFQSGALNSVLESDTGNSNLRITSGDGDSAQIFFGDQTNDTISIIKHDNSDNSLAFFTSATEAMRIDNSRNLLVGKTSTATATVGVEARANGLLQATRDGGNALELNRKTSDGSIIDLRQDGSTIGGIYSSPSVTGPFIGHINVGLVMYHNGDSVLPSGTGGLRDNAIDLGNGSNRFDDIFATNSTIQTSDRNEKQDIEELSEAEQRVAVVAKGLMRKYRWRDAVAEKGENARTHFGIIAQDLQDAFTAEGLDASKYAMFCSDTFWEKEISVDAVEADEENGIEAKDAYTYRKIAEEATEGYTEKTRLGVRYSELLAFIISAI